MTDGPYSVHMSRTRIKEIRKSKSMSAISLAAACGVSPAAVHYWESGCGISMENAQKVASILGVSLDELVAREDSS